MFLVGIIVNYVPIWFNKTVLCIKFNSNGGRKRKFPPQALTPGSTYSTYCCMFISQSVNAPQEINKLEVNSRLYTLVYKLYSDYGLPLTYY